MEAKLIVTESETGIKEEKKVKYNYVVRAYQNINPDHRLCQICKKSSFVEDIC